MTAWATRISPRGSASPSQVVRQRLKLARVSPKLIALYRKGEMTLDCLMAFAISDDHKQQEKIWKDLPEWSKQRCRHAIRDALTEAHIDADSKLARFVTVDAYEAAGGAVLRDLFDADSAGWITDPALLNRLAAEKLEREAESVRAQGWKWVEIMPDVAWDTLRSFDRVYPTPTEQQQAQIDELQAERDKLDEDEDSRESRATHRQVREARTRTRFCSGRQGDQRRNRHHRP